MPVSDAITGRSVALYLSSTAPDLQATLERFLARIRWQYEVADVYLFGSRARGDAHAESDADLAIVLAGDDPDMIQVRLEGIIALRLQPQDFVVVRSAT